MKKYSHNDDNDNKDNNIVIVSFDTAPFPYKHARRRITFYCQRIDVDIHIQWLIYKYIFDVTDVFSVVV